jgi:cyclic beta-1,2-glucan synthetase
MTTGFRLITYSNTRFRLSRIVHRPQTLVWLCWQILSAYDFGYITTATLIERTERTFGTLSKLDRQGGHFYNWYDTQSLHVLHPRYISTVDSGNLAGHLLTLRQGFLGLINQKVIGTQIFNGLLDTVYVLRKKLLEHKDGLEELEKTLTNAAASKTAFEFHQYLRDLTIRYNTIRPSFQKDPNSETGWWIKSFDDQLNLAQHELESFIPWAPREIPVGFEKFTFLTQIPTLTKLCALGETLKKEISSDKNSVEEHQWLRQVEKEVDEASAKALERMNVLRKLAQTSFEFADMRYDFLYDKVQRLLSIGFNADDNRLDASYYDLLASEARLSAFVAIAQGKLPQESWFSLGRRLTSAGKTPVLLSWSGSMFEYLMPMLVMPTYENTLLDEMAIGTVKKQIEYGEQHDVPWGISESCYNVVDSNLTYQYRAFGVPGLGFKRGLGQDLVIAPYATIMALMVDPDAAYNNLQRMKAKGFEGRYGFYEAVDYTPVRLSRGQSHAVIQTFMAHHQGMSMLSLAYLLLNQPMQKRFEADPQFQTALLLLQEQVPKTIGYYSGSSEEKNPSPVASVSDIRIISTPHTSIPEVQLLSNGRYHVMVTNAGGGYSRWHDIALTRWREDATADNWGTFCYVRDLDSQEFWSNAFQPTLKKADHYEAVFSQGKVEFRRRDNQIETYTEIIVSPEDDIEVRRIHLINHAKTKRNIEVTTYGEVVLAMPASDNSHPAFSNLFVQTEINHHQNTIVCSRRARSKDEQPPWMFHLAKISGAEPGSVSYETDRNIFIGRGNTIVNPDALQHAEALTGSQGSVLDPIVSVQYRISIEPGETVTVDMVTGIAATREASQMLIDKYQDKHLRDRAFELSWTHSQVVLRQIGASESDAQLYGRLASSILYANPALRAPQNIVLKNQRGQSALWAYSISGDLPIVLLEVSDQDNILLAKQMVKAQAYWNLKGLAVDLVIINQDPSGYRQVLQDQIQGLIAGGTTIPTSEKPGRIFVRSADQIPTEDLILLQTVARVIISDSRGTLADQTNKKQTSKPVIPKLEPIESVEESNTILIAPVKDLHFFNGIGGFAKDGREYIINTTNQQRTPLPWVNIIANPNFGTLVSESGSSYTWFENAHEFRLSPWHNDPVSDKTGEAFYLRDEETGKFWSPMPLPINNGSYITRHGFGYTTFEHSEEGIHSDVTVYVDTEASVKFVTIKLRNDSGRFT